MRGEKDHGSLSVIEFHAPIAPAGTIVMGNKVLSGMGVSLRSQSTRGILERKFKSCARHQDAVFQFGIVATVNKSVGK